MYRKNCVFAAACLGMLLFGIVFLSLGSVNNMLAKRFGLDNNAIGTLTALLPFGILCGSLVFGPIVDRFGYRWMLVSAALVVGAALEGMALADNRGLVQLCVFLIGFGGGILNGATNALTADVSEGERGAKLSLLGVFFGIGALTMPGTLALLSDRYAMSSIVAGIGALVLLPVAYCLAIRFPPPKQRADDRAESSGWRLFGDRGFLFACLAMVIQSGMEGMSNDWMTRFFQDAVLAGQKDVEKFAQLGLVFLTGGMFVTRIALSTLLRWAPPRPVLFASIGLAALGAALLIQGAIYDISLLGVALIGAGLAAGFPVVLGHIGDLYPQQSGTAFSIIFAMALVGNMTLNKTFGYVAERYGVWQYPVVLVGCLLCSALLLFLAMRRNAASLR
jgi:MFS transporter, FHS family, glucose/mannose:H+ symporter